MRAFPKIVAILLLGSLLGCNRSRKPQDVFSDFATGIPGYESVEKFTHPADALKGDYFSLDFIQSSNQFGAFMASLGVAQSNALSAAGVSHLSVGSKISPNYPWFLSLRAVPLEGSERRYRVHVEGQQPND